jgi:hypothetical protein
MRDDRADERFCRDCAAFGVDGEPEIAKNLERVNPGFDDAGFVAEEAGALANGGEKFPGAGRAGELEIVFGIRRGSCLRGGWRLNGAKKKKDSEEKRPTEGGRSMAASWPKREVKNLHGGILCRAVACKAQPHCLCWVRVVNTNPEARKETGGV